ncbi:MAG: FliH/SctL family protein [Terracidiphilus sp.]
MEAGARELVEIFEYAAGPEPLYPSLEGLSEVPLAPGGKAFGSPIPAGPRGSVEDDLPNHLKRQMADESQRSFEVGRERGRQEGQMSEREAQNAARAVEEKRRTGQMTELMESFAQERDRYLRAVEHEVVELALAVAARILRREAQMDPLLLTGAVRVALGQLSKTTVVKLRVPAAELDLWTEAFAHLPNLAVKPVVLAGEGMRVGDCAIETSLGSVDLGIRSQLGEIERGFFDRAGRDADVSAAVVREGASGSAESHS